MNRWRDPGNSRRCHRPSFLSALEAALLLLSLLFLCGLVAGCSSSSPAYSVNDQSLHPGVRLELRSDVVKAGQAVWYRIVNTEARAIYFGLEPQMEGLRHGRWIQLPITKHGLPVLFKSPQIGMVGVPARSERVGVPTSAGWGAGKYRLRQDVTARFASGDKEHLELLHYFRLTS